MSNTGLCIMVPNTVLGEVGDEFRPEVLSLLRSMAKIGYWPLDFGEAGDVLTELWFEHDLAKAEELTEHFIEVRGDV